MSVIKDVISQKDFLTCVKEAKEVSFTEQKEYTRLAKRKLMKQRYCQLFTTGMYSTRQLADIFGVSTNTIYKLNKDEEVQKLIEEYQNKEKDVIDNKLKALRERSIDTLSDLLNSDEDNVRLQAVKAILDKTGHADKKEQTTNVNITYEERLKSVIEGVSFDVQDLEYIVDVEES